MVAGPLGSHLPAINPIKQVSSTKHNLAPRAHATLTRALVDAHHSELVAVAARTHVHQAYRNEHSIAICIDNDNEDEAYLTMQLKTEEECGWETSTP